MIDAFDIVTNPWFYAAAVPGILLTGISKGGFAGGIVLIAVPLMALTISPVQAAGIMLPILILMDAIGLWAYRRDFDRRNLMIMVPGAIIGIAIGGLTAHLVNEAGVRLIVGAVAVVFTLMHWFRGGENRAATQPHAIKGAFWGAMGGYTSFVAHAGSPPFQVYMLPQKLDKKLLVGTSVMFFAIVNWVKLVPYYFLDQLNPGNLATSLILLPLAPIGMVLGIRLRDVIPERPFYRIIYVMIFIVGLKLLWDGASPFFV